MSSLTVSREPLTFREVVNKINKAREDRLRKIHIRTATSVLDKTTDALARARLHHLVYAYARKPSLLALEHLIDAANIGHPGACYRIACYFITGNRDYYIEKDLATARRYVNEGLKLSAEECRPLFTSMYSDHDNSVYRHRLRELQESLDGSTK